MPGMGLCRLPEDCFCHVLSLTSPKDVCRSAAVSSAFRSAYKSDLVWQRFLPSDCLEIISRSVSPVEFSSKKELYFRLCNEPILIDGGKLSFSLEKLTGRKCYFLSARELKIEWGGSSIYWAWISLPESRFSEVAELLNVCWLDINGKIDTRMLSPNTTYVAYLVLKITPEAYGLDCYPLETLVKIGSHVSEHTIQLEHNPQMQRRSPRRISRYARLRCMPIVSRSEGALRSRSDGWKEIELGEFFSDERHEGEVEMCLQEVKGLNWKKGLIIEGIEIRPKE